MSKKYIILVEHFSIAASINFLFPEIIKLIYCNAASWTLLPLDLHGVFLEWDSLSVIDGINDPSPYHGLSQQQYQPCGISDKRDDAKQSTLEFLENLWVGDFFFPGQPLIYINIREDYN